MCPHCSCSTKKAAIGATINGAGAYKRRQGAVAWSASDANACDRRFATGA